MHGSERKGYEEKYCADCGQLINAKAEICPKCGVRQMGMAQNLARTSPNGRSRLAAGLFALFLGGLGIHKFYLGQVGWGIIYLLFFWTFIPAIIGFIEGIIYLTMSEQDFDRRYGGG